MSNVPDNLQYTQDHEYIKKTDDASVVIVGITDYAQGELDDVVFVNMPKVGDKFGQHGVFGTIEAVKAVSELFCPLAGDITAINTALEGSPDLVNRDPYGDGWMVKLRISNPAELNGLLSPAAYRSHLGQ